MECVGQAPSCSGHVESVIFSRSQGYDYEFVPPLDPKYECAICLLGLRAPVQTSCGHRFCKDCIYSTLSLGENSKKCPIDNKPLSESDLFPDSCAEREVLQLHVRCPNASLGCKQVLDLMYIEHHTQACSFQPVLCPNECAATVLQQDLEKHLALECLLRKKLCSLCDEPYALNQEQFHLATCGQVMVGCEMCGSVVAREELPAHLGDSCPKVVVACPFAEHGCHHKMMRVDLDMHMTQSTQYHLQLLSSAFKRVAALVWDVSRSVGIVQSPAGSFSRQPSLRSQISASSPIPEAYPSHSHPERNQGEAVGERPPVFPSPPKSESSSPNKLHLHLSQLSMGVEGAKAGTGKGSSNVIQQEIILKDLCEKSLEMSQGLLHGNISLTNLEHRVEEVEAELGEAAKGSFCNGEYVWEIRDFLRIVEGLREKPSRVHHSPGFYTSAFGYKFCLRLNVTRQADEGQEWLSLFIHTMQGEHDHFLDWPFSGTITLSLLDCGSGQPKTHITETMKSNPNRQAFSRPQAHRNLKGFGYTEFALLERVLRGEGKAVYVHDGTMNIRAIVRPGQDAPSEVRCICHFHQQAKKV